MKIYFEKKFTRARTRVINEEPCTRGGMFTVKEAMFWARKGRRVHCHLCPHNCVITESKRGVCGVRENRKGTLYSLVYGKLASASSDPIEKKPLFHFYPGSYAYSIATVGCNFTCKNCQNYELSQSPKEFQRIEGAETLPEMVVEECKNSGCQSIAYTYSEPTIFYEYALNIAHLASREGIKNLFVTNGYINPLPLKEVASFLDAANIDLKSMDDRFYQKNCGGRLEPVLEAIKLYKKLGVWVELTTLIIPTLNDDEENLARIADFIKEVGMETPWHVSRFMPTYKLTHLPITPLETILKARKIGLERGLRYVYTGNIYTTEGESTFCHKCGAPLIEREIYSITKNTLKKGECPHCFTPLSGVGLNETAKTS